MFGPLGGKPQVVLIFGAVLSLGHVLIFGAGVYGGSGFVSDSPFFRCIPVVAFVSGPTEPSADAGAKYVLWVCPSKDSITYSATAAPANSLTDRLSITLLQDMELLMRTQLHEQVLLLQIQRTALRKGECGACEWSFALILAPSGRGWGAHTGVSTQDLRSQPNAQVKWVKDQPF